MAPAAIQQNNDLSGPESCGSENGHIPGIIGEKENVEPIAVIGFSVKFPGEASSSEGFWNMLENGRHAMTEFPPDRINLQGHYHPDNSRLDEMPVRGGHFVEEKIDRFDAPFFSITPAEAECMEPQQRGILETSYRALENAGITIDQCSNTRTAVHTGSFTDDYRSVLFQDPLDGHTYAASGLSSSMLANRVSWFFNLKGPSINLDTACSSSMTCLHLSCEDLRNGTTDMGIVGGCNLFYHPDYMKIMSNMNFLSPDSRSWSLDEKANGYARGEGFGILIVKRLSDAIRDGNTIRAAIRATALNQDGRTPGITVPSGNAHKELIRETYAKGNIDMRPTRFFEAHSTGTQAGDPVEANAVGEAFCNVRSAADPLWIGAVKSNVGHLEAGSGMASVLKSILVLEKGVIPPNAGFENLNKRVLAERYHLEIPTEARPWPTRGLRRICVNSFGFGGSNAVVILDDAHHYPLSKGMVAHHSTRIEPPTESELKGLGKFDYVNGSRPVMEYIPGLLVWSSVDEDGVKRMQSEMQSFFERREDALNEEDIKNIAYTLGAQRTNLAWRSFVSFSGMADLREKLAQALPRAKSSQGRNVAFVFTGQGAQYIGMGKELVTYPVFQESLNVSQKLLAAMGGDPRLVDAMFATEGPDRINEPQYSQPLCTALQIALVDLMDTFGVKPKIVVGHSSGEIAAAYCAGSLSRASALKIAFHRGRLAAKLPGMTDCKLSMMAAGVSHEEARAYLEKLDARFGTGRVDIACINSASNVTLSGDEVQLKFLEKALQEDGKFARKLRVDIAYHSRFMQPIAEEYSNSLGSISGIDTVSEFRIPMISSVTGDFVPPSELSEAEYWVRNMTNPVNFVGAISKMNAQSGKQRKVLGAKNRNSTKISDIVEIGPHHALRGPVRETLQTAGKEGAVSYHGTLSRTSPSAVVDIMSTAGNLFSLGYSVNLLEANNLPAASRPLRVDLPEYSFQHSRSYWRESRMGKNYRLRDTPRHDFLGVKSSDWNPLQAQWRNLVDESRLPWLQDHKLAGNCLYPAGGMVVMAIEAARQLADPAKEVSSYELREVEFLNAFRTVHGDGPIETRFSLSPLSHDPNWSSFQLFVHEEERWIEICHGQIRAHVDQESDSLDNHLHRWNTTGFLAQLDKTKRSITPKALYDEFVNVYDAEYGPPFQTLDNITISETGQVMADINTRKWAEVHGDKNVSPHVVHPTTVDGLFQLVFPASLNPDNNTRKTLVPTRVQRLWINARGLSLPENDVIRVMGDCSNRGYRGTNVRARVVSPSTDEPLVEMMSYETTIVASGNMDEDADSGKRKLCATLRWLPDLDFLKPKDLQSIVAAQRTPQDESLPAEFYTDLHLVIRYYLADTLDRLKDTNVQYSYSSHVRSFIRWMKYQTRDYSFNRSDKERRIVEDKVFRNQLIEYTKNFSAEGRVLTTLAESVYQIIQGELDPIQLLFEGTLASDYYKQVMEEGPHIPSLRSYLDLMGHKNPGMKILEIGSGTGSSAEVVTSALTEDGRPRWSLYDYTDVSPVFFSDARERFSDFSHCMQFSVLDASSDFLEQGFEKSSYDLVIAGNVLHALKNLRETLQNIRKLLKPNGKLLLFEATSPESIRIGLYGGVLKDWWNSIKDESKCSPLLSTEGWNEILRETGFNGLDLAMTDFEDPSISEESVLIASALSPPSSALDRAAITCVIDPETAQQKELADTLIAQLSSCSVTCEILSIQSVTSADIAEATCISLLEVGKPFLANLNEKDFHNFKHLMANCKSVLWVSHAHATPPPPEYALMDGLARVLRAEHQLQKLVTLRLEPGDRGSTGGISGTISNVLTKMLSTEDHETEFEYSQRDGLLNISRVIHSEHLTEISSSRSRQTHTTNAQLGEAPSLELQVESPGLLNTVQFQQIEGAQHPLADDDVVVRTHAFGLTSRDYQIASGVLNEVELGVQCSGVIEAAGPSSGYSVGERVCVVRLSAFQTLLQCNAGNVIKLPDSMSHADGASLPAATMIAVHSLFNIARLENEETVLIHDAATTVGQILVQLAQSMQARILVTVRTDQHRELLQSVYNIPEHDIFSKIGLASQAAILDSTDGEGVDVVINSARDEEMEASWNLLSSLGRFIHLGRREVNVFQANQGGNTSFSRVSLADLLRGRQKHVRKLIKQANTIIQDEKIRPPMGIELFGAEDVEGALRFYQDAKETGNSVIQLTPDSMPKMTIATQPLYQYDGNSTYVIAGGLGGLGRSIARWMAARGARHLLLLSRRGLSNPYAQEVVDDLKGLDVQVWAPSCDIADEEQLKMVVDEAAKTMPPIRGCIQAAMVLRDAIFENMAWDDWVESTRPKVKGSWNLHVTMPKGMDFFFFLSSVSTIIGGVSQSNYAAGNGYKDELCHYRNSIGERASVVNFGMLVSEGVVVETEGLLSSLRAMGQMMEISHDEMLAMIEHHCWPRKDAQSAEEYQTLCGIEVPSTMIEKGQEVPNYLLRPLFRHFHYVGLGNDSSASSGSDQVDYGSIISKAGSTDEAAAEIVKWLIIKLSETLGLSPGDIDTSKPISAYGVDSLLAMELRNWFERVLGAKIPVFEMLSNSGMTEVCHIAASRTKFRA